ncbi:MAG: hypothetical protein DLM69_02525 [Candidatus Chloroheliales bacterium]|nr:MAG: hypothetical protein DLM69_02525 [Chloroflexota bacterium]
MDEFERKWREDIAAMIVRGEPVPYAFLHRLFPDTVQLKGEYELVYEGKLPQNAVVQRTLAAPLQEVRTMPESGAPEPLVADWRNMLIFGDNLQVLKTLADRDIPGNLYGKVRLIYIDPPFASKQDMDNNNEQIVFQDKLARSQFIEFLRERLIFLCRLLTTDGSIYVHLDYRMASEIKLVLDEVFGRENFRNEIAWCYTGPSAANSYYPRKHDNILFYTRSTVNFFNQPRVAHKSGVHNRGQVFGAVEIDDPNIKANLEAQGKKLEDWWIDVWSTDRYRSELTDYPKQKPEALLERIIEASSEPGDIVLDAFAGSGTTAAVAERLGRRWVAIDCGKLAIYTIEKRLLCGLKGGVTPRPFTLYNAGLYDYNAIKKLDFDEYKRFVLQLFQARAERRVYGRMETHGLIGNDPVLVLDLKPFPDTSVTVETLHSIHRMGEGSFGKVVYVVAPGSLVHFLHNHETIDDTTYVMLKVPNSVIERIHLGDFTQLQQPRSLGAVNDPAMAIGFDFIRPPKVVARYRYRPISQPMFCEYGVELTRFESDNEELRGRTSNGNGGKFPTFAMLMVDPDYQGGTFQLGHAFDADELKKRNYVACIPSEGVGEQLMLIYIDIYGNEYTELVPRTQFTEGESSGEEEQSIY